MPVWNEIIGKMRDGYAYHPYEQSVEAGDIDADAYGFRFEGEEAVEEEDVAYQ